MQEKKLKLPLLRKQTVVSVSRNCTYKMKVSKRMQKQAIELMRAGYNWY
jgi:hypothetical protein